MTSAEKTWYISKINSEVDQFASELKIELIKSLNDGTLEDLQKLSPYILYSSIASLIDEYTSVFNDVQDISKRLFLIWLKNKEK